ncbi:hypothetical protein VTO42DRAFT_7460 [Malbranchea cinnamomea]
MESSGASPTRFPARTPEPQPGRTTLQSTLQPGFPHVRGHDKTEITLPSDSVVGQFSFAPATQTTVVTTTTTTTTTTFPPFVMRAPRNLKNLDPKLYPLASSPTPDSLKEIHFTVDGQSVIFREPEDSQRAFEEFKHLHKALRNSDGVIQSVTATGPEESTSALSHSPNVFSGNQSTTLDLRRRQISPAPTLESKHTLKRACPSTNNNHPHIKSARFLLGSQTNLGLATPETENSSFITNNEQNGVSRSYSGTFMDFPSGASFESSSSEQAVVEPGSPSKATFSAMESSPLHERRTASYTLASSPNIGKQARFSSSSIEEPAQIRPLKKQARLDDSAESQRGDSLRGSQSLPVENAGSQSLCLPSPCLSPVTAMNSQGLDTSFDSTEEQETDTDASFDHKPQQVQSSSRTTDGINVDSLCLMDMPLMLDYFESIPDKMKTYMMYQLLRRCPKQTLHFVADVVNPALKCDFLAQLPLELSLNIVKYLDVKSMCRASQVSKKWRQIINSDEKTWKAHFEADGYVLPPGELQRAIEEGWGWQCPTGNDDCELDLRSSTTLRCDSDNSSASSSPMLCGLDASNPQQSASPSSSRRLKRKAVSTLSSRKIVKRKHQAEQSGWLSNLAVTDSPYAAANAAALAVPYPNVGLPSLRSLHLYKSLYQRHYLIHRNWMRKDIKPLHFAFRAHDRHVVTCLQFDSDKILTGSDDTNIHVYDTKTGALRATLEGHEGGVWALQYYQNTLVSGSTDRSVRVWDIEKAKCTQIFQGHTSTVRCLQILLPTEIGKLPDGKPNMMPKEPLIITGSRDSTLRVWKLPRPGDPEYFQAGPPQDDSTCPYFVRVLTGHSHSVRAIAAHGDTLVSGSYDCTVRVWKISTGEAIHRLQGHSYKVYSVVLDHKRNRCISGSMDNLVKIWSLETGSVLYNLEGHTSLVGLLDLQADRLVSAAADSTLRIWDPENGQCKATLTAHSGAITCFQHDNQKVISGSDRTLKMWDVRTGECLRDLLTDLSGVWQVKFSDRRCVAAVQRDRLTYIEVLDFGASRDRVPVHKLGRRILVDQNGQEINEDNEEADGEEFDN